MKYARNYAPDNHSVRDINVLDSLQSCTRAQSAYLWAMDRGFNTWRAEEFAQEIRTLCEATESMITSAQTILKDSQPQSNVTEDQAANLLDFILKRHVNSVFPDSGRVPWLSQ